MQDRQSTDEVTRARLAYLSAGQLPLCGPRRACSGGADELDEANAETQPVAPPQPWHVALLSNLQWKGATTKHLIAVAVLLALAVGAALLSIARSSAVTVPVISTSSTAVPMSPSALPASSSAIGTAPATIRVHVAGAVKTPGVVKLAEGSIVADAIEAAGGLREDADPDTLNLAAHLVDGTQIIIGTTAAPAGKIDQPVKAVGGKDDTSRIDLNTATAQELETLPGIGPVTAAAIVAWREENGRFSAVEDLQQISGIGSKTIAKLSALVKV